MKYSIRSIAKVKSICLGTILRICAIHYPICQAYLTINIPIFFHYDSRSTVIDHSSQKNYRYIAYKINQCRCLTYISIRKFQLEGLSNTIHFQLLPNARSIPSEIKYRENVFRSTYDIFYTYWGKNAYIIIFITE